MNNFKRLKLLLLVILLAESTFLPGQADDSAKSPYSLLNFEDLQKNEKRKDTFDPEKARSTETSDNDIDQRNDLDLKKDPGNYTSKARNDRFDGAQYGASTFTDTDFGMNDFRDLFSDSKKSDFYKRNKDDFKDIHDELMRNLQMRKYADRHNDDIYKRLLKPLDLSPADWVPSALDPLSNGGFTTGADNGSPVPYRLNGHIDLD